MHPFSAHPVFNRFHYLLLVGQNSSNELARNAMLCCQEMDALSCFAGYRCTRLAHILSSTAFIICSLSARIRRIDLIP
uniref:Uncharacterized protein n=1 Tax=Acrobeloides nanus TaxID=290746 RepID=A0A914EDN2_9BILA